MDGEFVDFYEVLGVPPNATPPEIRAAYRRWSQTVHPDVSDDPQASEIFKRLQAAFHVLNDPNLRKAFDQELRARKARPTKGAVTVSARRRGTSEEPKPKVAINWTAIFKKLAVVFGAVAAVVILVTAVVTAFRQPQTVEQKAEVADAELAVAEKRLADRKRLLEQEEELRLLEEKTAKRAQDSAVVMAKLKAVELDGTKVLALVKALEQEVDAWETQIRPLLLNDRGKLLANSEDDIRIFQAIWKKPRTEKPDVRALRERVTLAIAPVTQELQKKEPVVAPNEALVEHLQEESRTLEKLIEETRTPRLQIEQMLAVAERSPKPSPVPLQQAIEELDRSEAAVQNQKLAVIERENQRKIQEAEAELKKQQGEDQLSILQAKTAAAKAMAEKSVEHEKLVQRAKSSETRALLSFFFTPGYFQPDHSRTAEKKPVSYSKLEAAGCLDPTHDGLTKLLHIMLSGYDKERPVWKEPTYVELLQPVKRERLGKIQSTLIELGPTLVELKMLEP